MNTTDSLGNGIGGGEVLEYWGKNKEYNFNSPFMHNMLMRLYQAMPYIIGIIIVMILLIMVRVIMNMYNIRSVRKGKGITSELEYMDKIRKRDKSILRRNQFIQRTTKLVQGTAFRVNINSKEYIEYNLSRAGVKIPGGGRYFKAEEWNAAVVVITTALVIVSVLVAIFANLVLGSVMLVVSLVFSSSIPMMYLRSLVAAKDAEIKENFADFYLMLHYTLLSGAKAPLSSIIKSYSRTTDSKEMQRLAKSSIYYMETYGEYEGSRRISSEYREVPEVCKLMRLIRQANQGGNVDEELKGFRNEILAEKRYRIKLRTDKNVKKAKASFNLLMPILVQAILSAMSIYLSDMGMIRTFVQ